MDSFTKKSLGALLMAGGSALGTIVAWHREWNLWLRLGLMILAMAALLYGTKLLHDAERQKQRLQLAEAAVRRNSKRIRKSRKRSQPKGSLGIFHRL